MLLLNRGQTAEFKFVFVSENQIYDPIANGKDIYFTVIRGDYRTGPVIDGPFSFVQQNPSMRITGSSNSYISTPDNPALDITGNIEIVCRISLDDWSSGTQTIVAKRSAGQNAYTLRLLSSGALDFAWWTAAAPTNRSSTVAPFENGKTYWIRFTFVASTGTCTWQYAMDQESEPTSWINIYSTAAGATSIDATTAPLVIGDNGSRAEVSTGNFYRVIIRNGSSATVADFESKLFNYGTTNYTDPYNKTWTISGTAKFVPYFDLGNSFILRTNKYEFTLYYTIPSNLFEGTYSVIAQTANSFQNLSISSAFQIQGDPVTLNPTIGTSNKSAVVNYKPIYQELNQSNTSTLLLLGHADGIELNSPIRIRSIQSAIDLLGSDLTCPLLRGVFNAYEAGARDIIICAVAPMSEYVDKVSDRLISTGLFNLSAATPSLYTFYQKYYERLAETYSILPELEFIDYIVPLEVSMINTGGVDFVTQLANYLSDFHNTTGYVQLGIIGAKTNGLSTNDVDLFEANLLFKNKFTTYNSNGTIASDIGRFIIPIYGEGVYQHSQLKSSYVSSLAASMAGLFSAAPLNMGIIRTRIPGVVSVFGSDLTQEDLSRLEAIGINTIYRGKKARRSVPFEVYISNEFTMAHPQSTLSKAAQMRLIARLVSEIKAYGYEGIGKLGYDKVITNVREYLIALKRSRIIADFAFNVEISATEVGKLTFYIEILSSLGLKKINFAISTGPGV